MFTRFVSVALAASSLVAAQTSTLCDPTKTDCKADPAVGGSVTVDFTKGANDFFDVAAGTTLEYDPTDGAVFTINSETDAPTISSKGYIFFGKVDVTVKASVGVGVVTSIVLQSDDLDEIDWEWLGGDTTQVQTNYFSKGDTTTYDRGGFSPVSNPQTTFDTYTIDWTSERINWIINGNIVRTLTYADAKNGASYPQSPMQLKLGTWVAGRKDAAEGTIQWAGGLTDFSQAPFKGYYQKIVVEDYANGVSGAKQYVYGDKTGTYQSIKVETEVSGDDTSSSSSSATSTGSSTGSSTATSTFSTVTSSTTASSGTTLGDSSDSSNAEVTNPGSSSSASSTKTSSSASASSTVATAGAGKTGLNSALLGAAVFAMIAV